MPRRPQKKDPVKQKAQFRKWAASAKGLAYAQKRAISVKAKQITHTSWLKCQYGLTPADFVEMLVRQSGRCAICDAALLLPHIDHDHLTGIIRELLCPDCNRGLGMFHDNTKLLRNAARYLKKHKR